MVQRLNYRSLLMLFVCISIGFLIVSCGPKAVKPVSEMDTPGHHFYTGMKFLDQGKYADANLSFDRAIALDPKYSKALCGKGTCKSLSGRF